MSSAKLCLRTMTRPTPAADQTDDPTEPEKPKADQATPATIRPMKNAWRPMNTGQRVGDVVRAEVPLLA